MSGLAAATIARATAEIAAATEWSVAADKRDIWAGLAVRSLLAKEPVATARGWAQLSQLADERAGEILERRQAARLADHQDGDES